MFIVKPYKPAAKNEGGQGLNSFSKALKLSLFHIFKPCTI